MKKYICQGNPKQKREYEKLNMQAILKKKIRKKNKYDENFEPKKKYEKIKYDEILNPEENMKKIKMRKILRQKENMKTTNMRKILNQKENMRKTNMRKILNQKFLSKVEKFCQQIRQDPYFICTLCHRCLYKRTDYLNMKSIIFLLQNSIAR